ncbi:hypothetical protein SpCBS45565_g03815 [Spizellomyces sp. 'palustris']|nr:hypothetical protein SpCBS45565_g03815 [Spizellomyces sp. 'palustris']
MAYKSIDIGVNLTDPMFRGTYRGKPVHTDDLEQVLQRARDAGVERIMVTGGNLKESKEALHLARRHDFLFSTVGCHPTRCQEFEISSDGTPQDPDAYFTSLLSIIKEDAASPSAKVVAVGECGLDYDRLEFCPKELQLRYYERQFELAQQTGLPMFLHNRNTGSDFIELTKRNRSKFVGGVVHSFDGPMEEMKVIIGELDLFVGINGCSLKTQRNLDVVKEIPVDRLMVETDAPWCDIRPTHASYKYLKDTEYANASQHKKKEKFEMGCMVKGRNEPCQIRWPSHSVIIRA